jgi:hypothetical protein
MAQALLEGYPTSGRMKTAVDTHLNPVLKTLGMREIRANPDTDKVYAASLDGTQVENWLDDLHAGLVAETPDTETVWGLEKSQSKFLRAITTTLKQAAPGGMAEDYAALVRALPVLTHWVQGMRLAMKMRPAPEDYKRVKEHLAMYVANKLLLWEGSNTWYDNECLYVMGQLHEKWGSLRLVSQEGMEAWQKKLNEVLRLSNSFANAGAIPKDVKRKGQAATDAYMHKRAADKPSSAQWVFEQAMLQQHAYMADTHAAREFLRKQGRVISWQQFVIYWRRYMVCAAMRCRLRARARCGLGCVQVNVEGGTRTTRLGRKAPPLKHVPRAPAGYHAGLLKDHYAYYAPVQLSAADLAENERRYQEREGRRERYAACEAGTKLYELELLDDRTV